MSEFQGSFNRPSVATGDQTGSSELQPLTLRIPEACRVAGTGRSTFYELIASGDIEIIKVGAITLVRYALLFPARPYEHLFNTVGRA